MKANPITIDNYFTFGDMPTDRDHVTHNQEYIKGYWPDFNTEHLNFYKEVLVQAVSKGFERAVKTNSFHGFNKGINFIVCKKINDIILNKKWSKNEKLQLIERLNDFKKNIRYSDTM